MAYMTTYINQNLFQGDFKATKEENNTIIMMFGLGMQSSS
jgi:hypothetical protein